MKIKRIEESNFDEISQWWLDWEIPIPDPDYLPHDSTGGYIVSKESGETVIRRNKILLKDIREFPLSKEQKDIKKFEGIIGQV